MDKHLQSFLEVKDFVYKKVSAGLISEERVELIITRMKGTRMAFILIYERISEDIREERMNQSSRS